MKTRFSNYKSHIKKCVENCEIACHFNTEEGAHPFTNRNDDKTYTKELKTQLRVYIIEKVKYNVGDSRSTKIRKLTGREGYWQAQLRTLKQFGGLNVRDERKIKDNARKNLQKK